MNKRCVKLRLRVNISKCLRSMTSRVHRHSKTFSRFKKMIHVEFGDISRKVKFVLLSSSEASLSTLTKVLEKRLLLGGGDDESTLELKTAI